MLISTRFLWLQEVRRFEHSMSRDYRLNRRLSVDCERDIPNLCGDVCDTFSGNTCGGAVLRCLTDNKHKIKKSACKQEVFYFIKMEVRASQIEFTQAPQLHASVGIVMC